MTVAVGLERAPHQDWRLGGVGRRRVVSDRDERQNPSGRSSQFPDFSLVSTGDDGTEAGRSEEEHYLAEARKAAVRSGVDVGDAIGEILPGATAGRDRKLPST